MNIANFSSVDFLNHYLIQVILFIRPSAVMDSCLLILSMIQCPLAVGPCSTFVLDTDMQTPGFGTFPGWEFKKYPQVTRFKLKSPGSEISWEVRRRSHPRENLQFC